MLDDDAYQWFEDHGGLTRANGDRFRKMVLSKGNTEDLEKMYSAWLGAEPSTAPMLKDRGLVTGERVERVDSETLLCDRFGLGFSIERFDEEPGPAGDGLGVGAGDGVAAAFEGGELHGEVADGGAFRRAAEDLEAGGLRGEAIEERVLVCPADDEEPLEALAGEEGDAVEHLGVARGQRVEDEAGERGRVGGALVERREAALDALRVDALRHAFGQQQVGIVDVEQAFGAGDLFRGGARVRRPATPCRRAPTGRCTGG